MTRIKICGITTPEQAVQAAAAGADFIGLVFAEGSRRRVTIHQAKSIIAALPVPDGVKLPPSEGPAELAPLRWFESSARYLQERLQRRRPLVVGVFADQSATIVNAIADRVGLDLVQLHGSEPWEEALAVRRPVIKAVRIGPGVTATAILEQIEVGTASLCLLDTEIPGKLGGTGERFDWGIAADLALEMPVMLAGGLTPDNVRQAINTVQPWAVDVSSGVEHGGVKDIELIRAFVHSVRSAEQRVG
ncbi:MAG TPA: phosphoribosylanthranilate isomerase [Dehalococcoidia bacterium]|nr:phosphoribosylanthranilate isomerase [Dehalococcoidia bacterium]